MVLNCVEARYCYSVCVCVCVSECARARVSLGVSDLLSQ